jgi:hypothetical protein
MNKICDIYKNHVEFYNCDDNEDPLSRNPDIFADIIPNTSCHRIYSYCVTYWLNDLNDDSYHQDIIVLTCKPLTEDKLGEIYDILLNYDKDDDECDHEIYDLKDIIQVANEELYDDDSFALFKHEWSMKTSLGLFALKLIDIPYESDEPMFVYSYMDIRLMKEINGRYDVYLYEPLQSSDISDIVNKIIVSQNNNKGDE